MSNLDKAAQAIWDAQSCGLVKPRDLADVLNEAGLLAPDLPEPYNGDVFKAASPHLDVRSVQAAGDQIVLHGYKVRHASIEESRRLALAILAAADFAGKEQGNE